MLIPAKRPLDGLDEDEETRCITERPPKRCYITDGPDYSAPGLFAALEAPSQRYNVNSTSHALSSTVFSPTCSYEDQFFNDAVFLHQDNTHLGTYQELNCEDLLTDSAEQNCLGLETHGYQDKLGIASKEVPCEETVHFSPNDIMEIDNILDAQQDYGLSLLYCDGLV